MQHNLKINISERNDSPGIALCKKVSLRERLLKHLLGENHRVMIIVPGDSVKTLVIQEVPEEGDFNESA